MTEKLYTDVDGNYPLSGSAMKRMIEHGDLLTACILVFTHLMKARLTPFHLSLLKFTVANIESSLVLAGRGLGKSYARNTCLTVTLMLRDPNIRIAVVTQTMKQSKRFINDLKMIFEKGKPLYEIWGDMRGSTWNTEEICLKRTRTAGANTVISASMESPANVISKHFDMLVLDDVVGSDNSRTKGSRSKFKDVLFSSVLPTLKGDEGYGYLNMIGTRYHMDDYWGEVLERGTTPVLIKPALIKTKKGELKSVSEVTRTTKELLFFKNNMSSIHFDMQFQQKVRKGGGGIFKPEWTQYFSKIEKTENGVYVHVPQDNGIDVRREHVRIYAGCDLAISQTATADYFVMSIIGVDRYNRTFLLDFVREKYTFNEQVETIKRMAQKWQPERIGLESVAYQIALFQEMKRVSMLPVVEIKTKGVDKTSRLNIFSGQFENGKVFFYEKIAGLDEYESEFYEYPTADHDDSPDSLEITWRTAQKNANHSDVELDRSILPF